MRSRWLLLPSRRDSRRRAIAAAIARALEAVGCGRRCVFVRAAGAEVAAIVVVAAAVAAAAATAAAAAASVVFESWLGA